MRPIYRTGLIFLPVKNHLKMVFSLGAESQGLEYLLCFETKSLLAKLFLRYGPE